MMRNGYILMEKIDFSISKLRHPQISTEDNFSKLKGGNLFGNLKTILLTWCTFSKLSSILHNVCFCLFVCFVALRPKSAAMVMVGWLVHLTTLFPRQA